MLMEMEFKEKEIPVGYKTEDTAKKWYDSDVLVLVGHDDVEKILQKNENSEVSIEEESVFLSAPPKNFEARVPTNPQRDAAAPKQVFIKHYSDSVRGSIFPTIGKIAKVGHVFKPQECVETIYNAMKHDSAITEFTVVEKGRPLGFMTKTTFHEMLGGRYGYWLHSKKSISELVAGHEFLMVDYSMPLDYVTKLSMQRPQERLYNPVVVQNDDIYCGIVTIKDLLDACTKIEVEAAVSANPLTKLPGNMVIEGELLRRIFSNEPYCIIYIDVDNFKAYNDAYGFKNGDLVLKFTSDILKGCAAGGEFVGHIGGDDFIIICDYHDGSEICRAVIENFANGINAFYRDTDLENGFIVSTNRHGVVDKFPIASLSIAGISNKNNAFRRLDDFSKAIAQLKKKCKKQEGNYFEIYDGLTNGISGDGI